MTSIAHSAKPILSAVPTEQGADDPYGAFVPGPRVLRPPTGEGALNGLSFAVQDLIDVAGAVTGAGNPDWAAAEGPARADAEAVARCLAAGARLAGKTATDELGFSLEGMNPHYGAPLNPADPEALCGGSASGSAAAVAGGLVDFALGVDTGGSVRIPAAFTRIWGFRPTHGRTPLDGVMPFARSYDTVGWMASTPETLELAGAALLRMDEGGAPIEDIRLAADAAALCDDDCAEALQDGFGGWLSGPPAQAFAGDWKDHFRLYTHQQALDICEGLGREVSRRRPRLSASGAQRFAAAIAVERGVARAWAGFRRAARNWVLSHLPPGRAWLLPTAPSARLPRTAKAAVLNDFYLRALTLNAIAGAAGAPQVQMPLLPCGVSLIGRPGHDRALLAAALRLGKAGRPC